jgi:hypothetical protein
MRRALGLALVLAAVAAGPAAAAVPGPTVLDFENQAVDTDVDLVYGGPNNNSVFYFSDGESCGSVEAEGGNFGPRFLRTSCDPIRVHFRAGQAAVSLFARQDPQPSLRARAAAVGSINVIAYDTETPSPTADPLHIVDRNSVTVEDGGWGVLRVRSSSAAIRRVEVQPAQCCYDVSVDDIGFSPTAQPDVDITDGPPATSSSGDATFTFAGNQDRMQFSCALDGRAPETCSSPKTYTGLAAGNHTFTVTGRDRWGSDDPSPPDRTWTVSPPVTDRDGDGVPDGNDNCPDNANAGQGDADKDRVGDACELLPSGNTPLKAGEFARVKLLSGEVFVKLPAGATGSAFTAGLRAPFQSSGFISLKGVAAVPMGSTLDTRRGEVALTAAINGQPARSRRQLRREARFRAGIFAIRQARKKRRAKRSKKIPPRAELASPAGAERPCRASGPPRGVAVRSLSMTAKGVFRAVGGASTATPAKGTATFITTDRCDGTITEVGRGRVAVIANRSGNRRVVRSGRAYIVRARLFAARKGRGR